MDLLILSDELEISKLITKSAGEAGLHAIVVPAYDEGEAIHHLASGNYKAALIPGNTEERLEQTCRLLSQRFPGIPLIGYGPELVTNKMLSAMDAGLWDFILLDEINPTSIHKTMACNQKRIPSFEQLHRMEQEIHEAKEYSNRLLARMSHEIRTPMNAVIGMAEMLFDTELNSKQRYYIETIHESGTLLVALFNDLLDYSKIEAGTIRIHDKPFDLRESMRECIVSVMEHAIEKGLNYCTSSTLHCHSFSSVTTSGCDKSL